MKLLTIYPIQSCNLHCYYCPMKKWNYAVDDPANKLTNELIFTYLDRYISPSEWLLEISGGEPGLYADIHDLIKGLEARGYRGLIRTNGTLPIPQSDNFTRIAAWHLELDAKHPPKYVDKMLILRNPKDDWEAKIQYCLDNDIPYHDIRFKNFHLPKEARKRIEVTEPPHLNKYITDWMVIYSSGRISACYSSSFSDEISVQNFSEPVIKKVETDCPYCTNITSYEDLLPEEWLSGM